MDKATFTATLQADRSVWETLLARLFPLGEERLTQPGATGDWSVKDVIAHVTWFEREMVGVIQAHALVGSDLWDLPTDARNAAIFQMNRSRPLSDILAEAEQVYAGLAAAIETLTDEDLNDAARFAGMPADWQPWQVIAGNSYEHYRDHGQKLQAWLAAR